MTPPYLNPRSLRRAFTRVKENHGCGGTDGVELPEFEAALGDRLEALRQAVESETYFAWPLRRIEVEKPPGLSEEPPAPSAAAAAKSEERRTLLVPAIQDRVLQTAVAAYIEPLVEKEFDDCSYAYRRGRSVRMAVEKVHALYQQGYVWLVDADIDHFFESVDAEIAIGRLATVVNDSLVIRLMRLWLDYAVWDGLHLTRPRLGLPQGAVVSPMLANLCLDVLDDRLLAEHLKLVRYADDFVILTKSRKAAERAYELTEETLASLRLHLHKTKTRIMRFSEGFWFLGVVFLKDLLMQPWKPGRKHLKVRSVAPPLPPAFFPQNEHRPLRQYREF